jgi:ABC-type amino acid transport substrate-binding protein
MNNNNSLKFNLEEFYPLAKYNEETSIFEGFSIDLANIISGKLGYDKTEYEKNRFLELITKYKSDSSDIISMNLASTKRREGLALFSEPYIDIEIGFAYKKDMHTNLLVDAMADKLIVGTVKHSFFSHLLQDDIFKNLDSHYKLIQYNDFDGIREAFLQDKHSNLHITLYAHYSHLIRKFFEDNKIENGKILSLGVAQLSFAFDTENQEMCDKFNFIIRDLKKDGTIARLIKDYNLESYFNVSK